MPIIPPAIHAGKQSLSKIPRSLSFILKRVPSISRPIFSMNMVSFSSRTVDLTAKMLSNCEREVYILTLGWLSTEP